ncbi:MAG: hypothetical protein RML46_00845 [Anaerolineae bacterium]|nr:hypothetical protein [Anaerolineae bacterium]MDW8067441.1 hypothetical protein [Anaerolineae bacterium]
MSRSAPFSKLLRISTHPGSPPVWLLPLWATLCGAVAVDAPLSGPVLARLMLALSLVELGWGELWLAMAATDWATPLARWRGWEQDPRLSGHPPLPYARPGSPADRLARWLAQLAAWGRTVLCPAVGPALGSGLAGLLLSLILSATLGRDFLLLTLGLLAATQLVAVADRGHGRIGTAEGPAFRLGFAWLAGHLIGAPLTLSTLGMATAFSLAVAGAKDPPESRHRALWIGGYLAAMLLLIALHRPLPVPFLAFLALPPLLADSTENTTGWFRRYGLWLVAAMLLAALAT